MFSPQKDSAAATIQKIYRGYCLRRELQGLTLTAARWHEILEFIRAHMLSNQQLQKDISKSERARRRWQKAIFFSARLGRVAEHFLLNPE
ncbi:hypothetical protein K493DRAFT_52910 [Basidiobolus meristosporus CBS 931.73]|uniref:Uncharacterized protein n=1 Tax=Basidiobolus meristosporus CBS 931.73 TaxID=1314790 RepID=A0A1Y1XZN6_9FUNG|nr:hypothetical protein K493DRAFT_52910 [Basidiobolus meristosporus CBS 931.73]|eukprot:ORX91199.1 hypothetical protein K493DRAFT_52910 [Basidiobolus meristosporus CBS 931.73]